jgi:hypothetical protein
LTRTLFKAEFNSKKPSWKSDHSSQSARKSLPSSRHSRMNRIIRNQRLLRGMCGGETVSAQNKPTPTCHFLRNDKRRILWQQSLAALPFSRRNPSSKITPKSQTVLTTARRSGRGRRLRREGWPTPRSSTSCESSEIGMRASRPRAGRTSERSRRTLFLRQASPMRNSQLTNSTSGQARRRLGT